jgi:hypothetical protein
MKNKILTMTLLGAALGFGFSPIYARAADDTMGEKAQEAVKDTGRAMKKGARSVKDKTCELANGKMECAGKKLKHKAKNTMDKVEDATD